MALEVKLKNSTIGSIFLWLIAREEAFIGLSDQVAEPEMSATMQDRNNRSKEQALAAFVQKKAEIDTMLARLQALSDEHFGYCPDEINWSHAEGLAHYAGSLKRVTDMAFNEGDHAE